MKLDRATINGQNGAVAAYSRDGLFMPALGLEGFILFRSESPGTSLRIVPKLDFSWMILSSWAENTNGEAISYKLDISSLTPVETVIASISIGVMTCTPAPFIVTPEMQLKVQGVNSLKSLIIVGKPVDTLDKYAF